MYVYQWYGKHKIDNVAEFNKDFKYIKTIAVSVFSGRESTSRHFGPLRLSLRILYNLIPVKSEVFVDAATPRTTGTRIRCSFSTTRCCTARSTNMTGAAIACSWTSSARRRSPGLISALLAIVSVSVERINSMFYKNWKMIGSNKPKKVETT